VRLKTSGTCLTEQLGVWLRPALIGIDDASTSSPCGPSARDALGQLTKRVPFEQWFEGKRLEFALGSQSVSSVCRRIALSGLQLVVLDGADLSGGCEGTARSRQSPLGRREETPLVRKASAMHWQVDVRGLR